MNEIGQKKVGQIKKWTTLCKIKIKMKSWTNKKWTKLDKIGQNEQK